MKLLEHEALANPRLVRIFLAEKGLEVERVHIDVPAGEHQKPAFLAKNPRAQVPVLELDDGTCIAETAAIIDFIDASHPTPQLLGKAPRERGLVRMWTRRMEQWLAQVASYFHHATQGLGDAGRYRNQDWGQRCRKDALSEMKTLNEHLQGSKYIAGEHFSLADIVALCAYDFAVSVGIEAPEGYTELRRWHAELSARPSAKA